MSLDKTIRNNADGLAAAKRYQRSQDETLPLPSPERLRAAAPDMLEALRLCVEEWEAYMRAINLDPNKRPPWILTADAAIAKATGAKP